MSGKGTAGPGNLVAADAAACKRAIRDKPLVLVDFWADWCGPCRALKPVVARLAERHPGLTVVTVDVDANPELAAEFGVRSLPCLILFKSGKDVDRRLGRVPYILLERAVARHA